MLNDKYLGREEKLRFLLVGATKVDYAECYALGFAKWNSRWFRENEERAELLLRDISKDMIKKFSGVDDEKFYVSKIKYVVGITQKFGDSDEQFDKLKTISKVLKNFPERILYGQFFKFYSDLKDGKISKDVDFEKTLRDYIVKPVEKKERRIVSKSGQNHARGAISSKKGKLNLEGFVESGDYE